MIAFGSFKLRIPVEALEETAKNLNIQGFTYYCNYSEHVVPPGMVEIVIYVSADFEGEFSNLRPY